MGTCVIAADTLNEGYQSMGVWHEGRARMKRGEKRQREEVQERKPRKNWRGEKRMEAGRHQQLGSFSTKQATKHMQLPL